MIVARSLLAHSTNPKPSSLCAANQATNNASATSDQDQASHRKYVESLEREVSLKRILEQNLRDLQSQYYGAVKELDEYKGSSETKILEFEQNVLELNKKLENSRNDLVDAQDQISKSEKQLNELKESSQNLEKKYHRAKKIIKDMQAREQSFNRREQLYQQKLDEIEYELGVLIESIDKTVYEDALNYFSLVDSNPTCQRQHQARLDVFGLIRKMLNNFSLNQMTQNPQIKQRVVSILEQQLANLLVASNGSTSISSNVPIATATAMISNTSDNSQHQQPQHLQLIEPGNKRIPNYQLASHRLSQPNLPHSIGLGSVKPPAKLFHGSNPLPVPTNGSGPSPPQSVNSYPSTNSLNSLNTNNNMNCNLTTSGTTTVPAATTNNNNNNTMTSNLMIPKQKDQSSMNDVNLNTIPVGSNLISDEKFRPAPDIQVPYQTGEWHDKCGKFSNN